MRRPRDDLREVPAKSDNFIWQIFKTYGLSEKGLLSAPLQFELYDAPQIRLIAEISGSCQRNLRLGPKVDWKVGDRPMR